MPDPWSEIENSSSPRERLSVTHTCVAPPCLTALAVASEMLCEISCTIQQGTSMSGGSRIRSIWQSHSFRRKATKCDSSGESILLKSPSDDRRSSTTFCMRLCWSNTDRNIAVQGDRVSESLVLRRRRLIYNKK